MPNGRSTRGRYGGDGANLRALAVTDYAVRGEDFAIRFEGPYVSVRSKKARENGSQGGQTTGKTFGKNGMKSNGVCGFNNSIRITTVFCF